MRIYSLTFSFKLIVTAISFSFQLLFQFSCCLNWFLLWWKKDLTKLFLVVIAVNFWSNFVVKNIWAANTGAIGPRNWYSINFIILKKRSQSYCRTTVCLCLYDQLFGQCQLNISLYCWSGHHWTNRKSVFQMWRCRFEWNIWKRRKLFTNNNRRYWVVVVVVVVWVRYASIKIEVFLFTITLNCSNG